MNIVNWQIVGNRWISSVQENLRVRLGVACCLGKIAAELVGVGGRVWMADRIFITGREVGLFVTVGWVTC